MSLEPQWLGLGDAMPVLEPVVLGGEVFQPLAVAVDECQRHKIRPALEHCGGNWASAARLLGVDSSNLRSWRGGWGSSSLGVCGRGGA